MLFHGKFSVDYSLEVVQVLGYFTFTRYALSVKHSKLKRTSYFKFSPLKARFENALKDFETLQFVEGKMILKFLGEILLPSSFFDQNTLIF